MKTFLAFWKKDIINKLIVIVLLGLAGAVIGFGWLVFNMPQGRSLSQAFADFLPAQTQALPTFDINAYLTQDPNTPAPQTAEPILTLPPIATIPTPMPTVELLVTPTLEVLPTPALPLPTQASQPTAQSVLSDISCIPSHPPQTGKVVEILDGNTVRILIDKLVYVVRYTGVAAPENKTYADAAKAENSKLVYGKEVSLITDISDKDDRGRLLRYVLQGDIFINTKLIQQGLGTALDVPPDSACAAAFKQAEQSANAAGIGMWSIIPTP